MPKKSSSKIKKIKTTGGEPLAITSVTGGVAMLEKNKTGNLFLSWSTDGLIFTTDEREVVIKQHTGRKENLKLCSNFCLSQTPNSYLLTYVKKNRTKQTLLVAKSLDLYEFKIKSETAIEEESRSAVSYNPQKNLFTMWRDGLFIRSYTSPALTHWKERPQLLFTSRNNEFDKDRISIIGSIVTKDESFLFYDASLKQKDKILLQAGVVIFSREDFNRISWRSHKPIWQGIVEIKDKKTKSTPIGVVQIGKDLIIYWLVGTSNIISLTLPGIFKNIEETRFRPAIFHRFEHNPIISPRETHDWEIEGTFNPAVVDDEEGMVHLLYRAIGRDGISRIGYAQSKDGSNFEKRSSQPIFEPSIGFGIPDINKVMGPIGYHPAIYTSGGGWGGSEDPRTVRIDGKIYMTYVAFEGWNSVRIALTSISVDDFKNERWKWRHPVFLSPPGRINKNWLLFPEKINGKFAVLHSIAPEIMIDYVDDVENLDSFIESTRKDGPQPGRKNHWDSLLRGSGPPPIKTEKGWLLLYHALEGHEMGRYKLGAMILNKDNPTEILYRSKHPILAPDMHYENNGKPGVVYASGALIRGDELYIYYGGADKVVCVAKTPLNKFLDYLVTGNANAYELARV